MSNVAGLILAAGASCRMGSPKPLLKINDKTLLEDQVERVQSAGITEVYVVIGAKAAEIKRAHPNLEVNWILNNNWEMGKFSSVVCGMRHLTAIPRQSDDHNVIRGVLLLPIDTVGVPPAAIKQIVDKGLATGKNIIPTFGGSGGHPVFIGIELIDAIQNESDANARLDKILKSDDKTEYLEVSSKNILRNINSPEDLSKIVL